MKFDKEFTPEDCRKLENMASIGLSQKAMATIMGVSETTLERMIKHRDAVREAIDKGRATGEFAFTKTAFEKAISFENFAFSMFYAKIKFGWRETQHFDLTVRGGEAKTIEEMTPEEREARIQTLLAVRTKLLSSGAEVIDVGDQIDETIRGEAEES